MELLIVSFIIGIAFVLFVVLKQRAPAQRKRQTRQALSLYGAARLSALSLIIEDMAKRGGGRFAGNTLFEQWELLEIPLLEVLPDCPPDERTVLIARLNALYEATAHRALQKQVMDMRRKLTV